MSDFILVNQKTGKRWPVNSLDKDFGCFGKKGDGPYKIHVGGEIKDECEHEWILEEGNRPTFKKCMLCGKDEDIKQQKPSERIAEILDTYEPKSDHGLIRCKINSIIRLLDELQEQGVI